MVANLEPRIRELSRELLDPCHRSRRNGPGLDYAVPLPIMVIAEMLGIPIADRAQFKRWSDAILGLANTLTGGEKQLKRYQFSAADNGNATRTLCSSVETRRTVPPTTC